MSDKYVLILVGLNPDSTDISGVEYPEIGHVESKDYRPNQDIQKGLYGILWGQIDKNNPMIQNNYSNWRVIKSENNEIIKLDVTCNLIKFRKGMVVFSGNHLECSEYICNNCNNKEQCDKSNCKLLGLQTKISEQDTHVIRQGTSSVSKTTEPVCHAINLGELGYSTASGWGSHAISLAPYSISTVEGDEGIAFAAGTKSQSIADQKLGIAINSSLSGFVSSGHSGCSVGLGYFSSARTGNRGFIALKYNDGKRDRLKIGYVGEDGIKPNTTYYVSESGEFEILESGETNLLK